MKAIINRKDKTVTLTIGKEREVISIETFYNTLLAMMQKIVKSHTF